MGVPFRLFDDQNGERVLNIPMPLVAGAPPSLIAIATMTASADPTVSQDSSQGYAVGSVLFNATAGQLRWWECRDATVGAAKWVYSGADYANGGTDPNNTQVQAGSSTALIRSAGNINTQVVAAGVIPGATGADNVLAVFSLPANFFDGLAGTNRGISITAQGKFAATANNKQVKIIFNPATAVVGSTVGAGGTTVADTGVVATNNLGWSVQANIFKTGAAGSNTQLALHQQAQAGSTVGPLLAPTATAAVENAPILIAITGNATTVASDIVFNFLEICAMD
jgi:hypothetical protein